MSWSLLFAGMINCGALMAVALIGDDTKTLAVLSAFLIANSIIAVGQSIYKKGASR